MNSGYPILEHDFVSESKFETSRLTPFIGIPAAIGLASLLFGLAHFAPGPGPIVLADIGLIVVNSILYGVMFARRNNLWVVWLAHLLGDIFGLVVLASV